MSDPRPDEQPPPRVEVHLPGGRTTPGRIHRWRQGLDGRWWAEVTIHVPAGAVGKLDGEDYGSVPREPAGPRYVMTADTRQKPPAAEVHRDICPLLDAPADWIRVTAIDSADQARDMLRFDDTTACTACHPDP